ncbi:MAG: alanine--tRNA ligase [Patescibacteria group bacterium]
MITSKELRQKYLDFFKTKGHTIISSASLIPENDPTILFTTAGMHPLVPYLFGEKHPAGKCLTNAQKCIRTNDIDEVGDITHHTFFEMLGNWSLGDYFKEEAIAMSWEFLTSPQWLNLDKNRIAVSVFAGDNDVLFDQEAYDIWENKIKISKKKIAKLPKKDNWWNPVGSTGPCGPDTEIFYWVGTSECVPEVFDSNNSLWVEIWNNVFMQYNKIAEGKYELLKQRNVDTGMGLERILSILNNLNDDYKTDLFSNIIFKIEYLSNKKYNASNEITKAMRIIADHLKAAAFIIADDKSITPSNTNQGYIVRRLIRRAIRYGKQLGISQVLWIKEIAKIVAHDYASIYPEVQKNINFVIVQFNKEEEKFNKTLEHGLKKFVELTNNKTIDGIAAFNLYQTYGFPIEITQELAKEKGISVDEVGYKQELIKHQKLSRTVLAGMFKGGLINALPETIKYHTAVHLLLAALRQVLGKEVIQRGSNITAERLRFDFLYNEKMTKEQLQQVEDLVNQAIKQNLKVTCEELTLEQAKQIGAIGVFESKYGERVKVYTIGQDQDNNVFSKEICNGPHVKQTSILGRFKIQKEESSSAGVRRIKAILD